MKLFITKLKRAFAAFKAAYLSKEIDSKPFRRILSIFYNNREHGYIVLSSITDIKVFDKGDFYSLQITTHKPGVLIGKGGHFIDEMRDFINYKDEFDKPIKIDLQESKIWLRLYSSTKHH